MTTISTISHRAKDAERRVLHKDEVVTLSIADARNVDVHVSFANDTEKQISKLVQAALLKFKGIQDVSDASHVVAEIVSEEISRKLTKEFQSFQEAYARFLREAVPLRTDQSVLEATIAVQRRAELVENTPMIDQKQACDILGLSKANPSATMKRYEDKGLLRFRIDGKVLYPLLQFDIDKQAIHPEIFQLVSMKPRDMSQFALLDWLVSENTNFDTTPAKALSSEPEAVMRAFADFIEEPTYG